MKKIKPRMIERKERAAVLQITKEIKRKAEKARRKAKEVKRLAEQARKKAEKAAKKL